VDKALLIGHHDLDTDRCAVASDVSEVEAMSRVRVKAFLSGCVLTLLWCLAIPSAQAATLGSAIPPPAHVDGEYRIVSTDCYFGAGACTKRFDIEQRGGLLTAIGDRYFHGRIQGDHVRFGEIWPPGVSEDGWTCQGTTKDHGRTITGTMTDGIGGTGTFRLTFLHP
jgi:hypothetical protein